MMILSSKKIVLYFFFFIGALSLCAQKYPYQDKEYEPRFSPNEIRITVYCVEYKEAQKKMEFYIQQNKFTVLEQEETKRTHRYEFNVSSGQITGIDSLVQKLGYVSNRQLNATNNEVKLSETKLEQQYLESKKTEFEKMLQRIDSGKSDKYYQHWEKIRDIDAEIYKVKKKIKQLESVSDVFSVHININDEQTSPSNSKVNFVHMPGAEFAFLSVENPKSGISHASYQGIALKYLFTRGKSYFSLGALKSEKASAVDSTTYDELFNFTFGQDWYSRYLGRGSRKFLNLYIGYQTGVTVAYNDKIAKGILFSSPSTGLELFKNKFLLMDCNFSYYLPMSSENRNLRGYRASASLNFTF